MKLNKQMAHALDMHIPFMVIFGEDELAAGRVKIKDLAKREESDVAAEDLADELIKRGVEPGSPPNFVVGANFDEPKEEGGGEGE